MNHGAQQGKHFHLNIPLGLAFITSMQRQPGYILIDRTGAYALTCEVEDGWVESWDQAYLAYQVYGNALLRSYMGISLVGALRTLVSVVPTAPGVWTNFPGFVRYLGSSGRQETEMYVPPIHPYPDGI